MYWCYTGLTVSDRLHIICIICTLDDLGHREDRAKPEKGSGEKRLER